MGYGRAWKDIVCKDLDGHGRAWKDIEGPRRTWKDIEGHPKDIVWKDLEGHGRAWKDIEGPRHGRTSKDTPSRIPVIRDSYIDFSLTSMVQLNLVFSRGFHAIFFPMILHRFLFNLTGPTSPSFQ